MPATSQEPLSILFVCTGNTCRSPMTMAIANAYFERCKPSTYIFDSAASLPLIDGTESYEADVHPLAVKAIHDHKIVPNPIRGYQAKALTLELIQRHDVIVFLKQKSMKQVKEIYPDHAGKFMTFLQDTDIPDPFDGEGCQRLTGLTANRLKKLVGKIDLYRQVVDFIESHMKIFEYRLEKQLNPDNTLKPSNTSAKQRLFTPSTSTVRSGLSYACACSTARRLNK